MRTRNTKSKLGFVLDHVYWGILGYLWYRPSLFRCLEGYTGHESKMYLLGMILIYSVLGIVFEFDKARTNLNVFFNLVAGFGLYTVFAYLPIKRKMILTFLIMSGIIALIYSSLILFRRIKNKEKYNLILKRRLLAVLGRTRIILCTSLSCLILVIGVHAFAGTLVKSSVTPTKWDDEGETIEKNITMLVLLDEDKWYSLSLDHKLSVLQTVANIERCSLRIPHELNVKAENLDGDLQGYYSDGEHKVVVNMDSLLYDPPYDLVNAVAHESYHSLEYRLIDAYNEASDDLKSLGIYEDAKTYKEEFDNYDDGEEDFLWYYCQQCEEDARDHAEYATRRYYRHINDYLDQTNDMQ